MKSKLYMKTVAAFFGTVLWAHTSAALATAQIPDEIVIDGKTEALLTNPLEPVLRNNDWFQHPYNKYKPNGTCSALWRGYRATWEVKTGELYLIKIDLDACSSKPREMPLTSLFPGTTGPVKATWYTGSLTVPLGKIVEYVHMGYGSRYEGYLFMDVKDGKVVRTTQTGSTPRINPEIPPQKNQDKQP